MERVASTNSPQPVIAIALKRDLDIADLAPTNSSDWIVVVDKISDPGNLGTILRSAEAAGAKAVVLTTGTVDAFSPKVVRASAGAIFNIPVYGASRSKKSARSALRYGDLRATKCITRAILRPQICQERSRLCSAMKRMDCLRIQN